MEEPSLETSTHVDRIDTTKITTCPHNLAVKRVRKLGVIIFLHPDNTPCTFLNSFKLTGDILNAEDALLNEAKATTKDPLEWLNNPITYSRLGTDKTLMKRLAHDLDHETSSAKVEKAFLSIARGKNACDIIRAMIKALPDKETIILNNTAAIYANYSQTEDVSHIYPIVLEYQRKILDESKAKKDKEAE